MVSPVTSRGDEAWRTTQAPPAAALGQTYRGEPRFPSVTSLPWAIWRSLHGSGDGGWEVTEGNLGFPLFVIRGAHRHSALSARQMPVIDHQAAILDDLDAGLREA